MVVRNRSLSRFGLLAMVVLAAGCGKATPEGTVTCGQVDALSFETTLAGAVANYRIIQEIVLDDEAYGGVVPLNDTELDLVATGFHEIGLCEGSITDCAAYPTNYDGEITATTDERGVLEYSVTIGTTGMQPGDSAEGGVLYLFGGAESSGCDLDTSVTLTEATTEALSVGIIASPATGTAPQTVSFTAAVSGGTAPYQYAWDFGAQAVPAVATGANPTATFNTAGTFTVSLSVTDGAGDTAQDTADIVISP